MRLKLRFSCFKALIVMKPLLRECSFKTYLLDKISSVNT